ncbi:MAG: hypothetical protein JXK07_06665 [Spirochaetes bacterium]|nr:hypothetical protein [Spirochaetota bacterium]MBN2771626.1 hypothetical protein [Spirochaetota bacterium]HRX15118.1 hypothetical protein [Spirochaetota bacterium]
MQTKIVTRLSMPICDIEEMAFDEEIALFAEKHNLLESEIIYFSAGESKIKEVLIKHEPSLSV